MKRLTFVFSNASYFNGHKPDATGAINSLAVLSGCRPVHRSRKTLVGDSFVHHYFGSNPDKLAINIISATTQKIYCEKGVGKDGKMPESSASITADEEFSALRYGSVFTDTVKMYTGGSFRSGVISIASNSAGKLKEVKRDISKEGLGKDDSKTTKKATMTKWFDETYGEMFDVILKDWQDRMDKGDKSPRPPNTYSRYTEKVKYFAGGYGVENGKRVAIPRLQAKAPETIVTYSGTITVAATREFYTQFTEAYRKAGIVATIGDGGLIQLTELPNSIEEAEDL